MSIPVESNSKLRQQLSTFLLIGGSSVCIDLLTYHLLVYMAVNVHVAKACSYVAGMIWGYFGNKVFTFRVTRRSISEPILYASLYAVTLGINVLVNAFVLNYVWGATPLLGFVAATGVSTVLNFLGMKYVTFRAPLQESTT